MKVGVLPLAERICDPEWMTRFSQLVERTPVESVWLFEHVVVPERYESRYPFHPSGKMPGRADAEIPDPLQWLAHLAALTSRVRLGTGLMILPLHNPLALAKRLSTLDRLSGGRVIAGFGLGWLAEEYAALGIPFSERGRRADESLQILREAWTHHPSSFHGRYHHFTDVHVRPTPARPGGVPIILGGASAPAMRRAAHFADGVFLLGDSLDDIRRQIGVLRAEAAAAGRPPEDLEITVDAPARPADVDTLEEWGVDRIIIARPADDLSAWGRGILDYTRLIGTVEV